MRFVSSCFVLSAIACASHPDDSPARRAFVEKAAHALHPSAPALDPGAIDALVAQSDDDLIATLYADPATRDAVLGLSLSFLGAPVDELHAGGAWSPAPFVYAPAIAAARAFRDGGDPLAPLLTTRAASPVGIVQPPDPNLVAAYYGQQGLTGTNAQQRGYVEGYVLHDVASLRTYVAALSDPIDMPALCSHYQMTASAFVAFVLPDMLGVPPSVSMGGYPQELGDPDSAPLDYACPFMQPIVATTRDAALAHIDHATQLFQQLFARLEPVMAKWEQDAEGAFDPVDYPSIGWVSYATQPYYGRPQFYPQFWQMLQNSSTNFDRRRGAYVLDRYFCDDLRPVGAALPTTAPGSGKHASDPGCAACHFKLDPMAGFFRREGYFGIEFDDKTLSYSQQQITFDDFASADFATYDAAWKSTDGFSPPYNVGYIRSTRDASLNSYGNSLTDLDAILQQAPEVQRCFAQRVFEYFNGADQAVDPGYLDDVAADMQQHGNARLERAIARVLAGATFRASDRNSTVCYDLAPGAAAANRPPCEVASILRASCTTCHGGGNPQAGLDLSQWVKLDGGYGFPHVVGGQQQPRLVTFQHMHDRVTTSDPTLQMPMGKDMALHSREQLAVWLQDQLGN